MSDSSPPYRRWRLLAFFVKQIIQNFILITDMEEHKEENWIYDNMEIKSAIITSQLDEISEFSVVLRNY